MLSKLNYVSEAEKVIMQLERNKRDDIALSTNQIRNVLTLMTELYNMIRTSVESDLNEDVMSQIQYNKMKLIYMAGRERTVKDLLNKSHLIEHLDSIGNSRERLVIVCRYVEALVAYHKFNSKN